MRKTLRLCGVLLVGMSVLVRGQGQPTGTTASGLTGSWRSDPPIFLTLTLEAGGPNVTGVISRCSSVRHAPTEIVDGHVDGETITFRCTSPDGGRSVAFRGRLTGDEITFNWELEIREGAAPPGVFNPFAPLPGRRMEGPPQFTVRRAPDDVGQALVTSAAERARTTPRRTPVTFDRILGSHREPQNWLTYSGNVLGHRHSGLTHITPANVGHMELAWVWQQAPSAGRFEATPIVVDGTLYTVQAPNDVVAIDAASGQVRWIYRYEPLANARASSAGGRINRGLAIAGDTLFLGTLDARLLALDANSGRLVWNTVVADPVDPSCQVPRGWTYCYNITLAPLIVEDKVLVGVGGGDGNEPGYGIRGFIAAFDIATGKEVWRFHTIPGPGEHGHETWSGDSWKTGGAGVWLTGSYDPELNLTYWGIGNPTPSDGSTRLGDNLYSDSVVALDADTGERRWHYQFTPHDEIDWDAAQIPVLVDLQWEGRPRKAMLWTNKNGVLYLFDRATGEFLRGQSFVPTPWLRGFEPTGRPIVVPGGLKGDSLAGTNWHSPSFSPSTGLFYVSTRERTGPGAGNGHGAVQAFDPTTGVRRWEYKRPDAWFHSILTTASDLLFTGVWGDPASGDAGRREDGLFYALDARTGHVLWYRALAGSVFGGGPISYAVGDRQYVAVTAGNVLYAFALRQ